MLIRRLSGVAFFSVMFVASASAADTDPVKEYISKAFTGAQSDSVPANETVLSRVPFRTHRINNNCSAGACGFTFATVPAKHREEITNISCGIVVQANATDVATYSVAKTSPASFTGYMSLEIDNNDVIRLYVSNNAVFVPVNAGEHFGMSEVPSAGVSGIECGISGEMVTLQ